MTGTLWLETECEVCGVCHYWGWRVMSRDDEGRVTVCEGSGGTRRRVTDPEFRNAVANAVMAEQRFVPLSERYRIAESALAALVVDK